MYVLTNGERIVKDFSFSTCTVSGILRYKFTSFIPFTVKYKFMGYLLKPFLMDWYYNPVKFTLTELTKEYVDYDKPFIIQWVGNDKRLIKIDSSNNNLSKVKDTCVMVKGMGYFPYSDFKVFNVGDLCQIK